MPQAPVQKEESGRRNSSARTRRYQDLQRRTLARLLFTYLAPFVLLTAYFHLQSTRLLSESRLSHLRSIAEQQTNTLDLFLRERVVNLSNLINDPSFDGEPSSTEMEAFLNHLQKSSNAFVDVGFFDASGIQTVYAGPFPSLTRRDYSSETWYAALKDQLRDFIITDIYLGFRGKPHFTIGVRRVINGRMFVLRATLDPGRIYDYFASFEGSGEVYISIVNAVGTYQVVTPHVGTLLEESSLIPPREPRLGVQNIEISGKNYEYSYSWLRTADWALIAQWSEKAGETSVLGLELPIALVSFLVMFAILLVIIYRTKKLVHFQEESDQTKLQLEHASKLASIGELAAGIAHEINNPLAVISEEAGLVKDLTSPEFGGKIDPAELDEHLSQIQKAVFRCRDITRKLLGFVRQTDILLTPHNVNDLLEDILSGFLTREMETSNIRIIREFADNLPTVVLDGNQMEQVLLNLIKNGMDAIGDNAGELRIRTTLEDDNIVISITDSGRGMSRAVMEKIFMPFFTTKEVGKGTGLGLSVSYSIVKSLGGKILVDSVEGRGSTFSIVLPTK